LQLALAGFRAGGKTTLFNAVTGAHAATGGYAARANIGQVKVPDERLDVLVRIENSKKITHAVIDFRDLVGLAPSSSPDAKANANTVAELREPEGLVLVVRGFENDNVAHPLGSIDPARDVRALRDEFLLADTIVAQKRVERLKVEVTKPKPKAEKERDEKELAAVQKCVAALEAGGTVRDVDLTDAERATLTGFRFLTQKPCLVVVNCGEGAISTDVTVDTDLPQLSACAEIEAELAGMDDHAERATWAAEYGFQTPVSHRLAELSYHTLDLITFLTCGPTEARAWTARRGVTAVEAAGKIHTDLARGFIRAETTAYQDLLDCGDFKEAKAQGKTRLEGKEYVVQEGDVILFRHNA